MTTIETRFKSAHLHSLLKLSGTVVIPATDKFVARDKFVLDTNDESKVKFFYIGRTFKITMATLYFIMKNGYIF